MYLGEYPTIYKGEDAIRNKKKKGILTQVVSSKTLEGAKRQIKKYRITPYYIIKATNTNKYYGYV